MVKDFAKKIYYRLRVLPPVWNLLNIRTIWMQLRRPLPARFPDVVERIANDLKRDGISVTHFSELIGEPELLQELMTAFDRDRQHAKTHTKKLHFQELWDLRPTLDGDTPFVRFSLHAQVMAPVNKYLGMYARCFFMMPYLTVPVEPGAVPQSSQRWHRDPEDRRMCKVFIYLNDVDETAGPFMYVAGSQAGGKYRSIGPQRPPAGFYPPEGLVDASVDAKDIRICTGKAGTIIFCDTSGLHKGGYATVKERWMYITGFFSEASPWKQQPDFSEASLEALRTHPAIRFASTKAKRKKRLG